MRWFRVFSLALRPRRILTRRALAVEERRTPTTKELLVLPANWVILRCTSQRTSIEIAMAETTLNGFLSWLEAAPPGTTSLSFAA
jgi:hypothetical protein